MKNNISILVSQLGKLLKEKKLSLVTAESCTGGGLAYFISSHTHSSASLERGYVTYSNQAKEELLNVKPLSLQTKGPVSKEVAIEMAKGALKNSGAQLSISITGIAGPDKTPNDNASAHGVVWIGCYNNMNKIICKKYKIRGDREKFIEMVIIASLKQLLVFIKKN